MRVAITSRIFEPEPSAASFRLAALADSFVAEGHEVMVLTVRSARGRREAGAANDHDSDDFRRYRVQRFPVLRDRTGYVRGYLQYLSFDVPLFFRILCGPKRDIIVTEPPPTTGVFVRIAARLRRTPYAYYAADIWSDAAESTGAFGIVVDAVRRMERFALSGAHTVLSVNEGVSARVREIAPRATVRTVGNGVDTEIFRPDGAREERGIYAIYSGTASEWQGAGIFIDALERILPEFPDARLVFLGHGSDWESLRERAEGLPVGAVNFIRTVPPDEAAEWIRGAVASVASIRPDAGYNFAFPTKVFASWACGTPVVFAGEGRVHEFMREHASEAALGSACAYDVEAVAEAMRIAFGNVPGLAAREALGSWAELSVGLHAVAERVVRAIGGGVEERGAS
ncbi:glycosyltransferase family 4 protein [Leucobacter tardus]|uniref:D-inositol 3-phosphate glycosyltransferase n=1 Tax=Leucobacter tardus TaxID=501483 RepID=A0A939QIM6_9MICO|nr:glycosyltransferase family 4 protein [Leucobacter tardus]MBO2988389.1 glycosyltransferase family 4 protein [Leucobacter tardus]